MSSVENVIRCLEAGFYKALVANELPITKERVHMEEPTDPEPERLVHTFTQTTRAERSRSY